MSSSLDELCSSTVEEIYGEFHARLFSYLTNYGRLSAQQLAQRSRLPLRQVKAGLAALTQQRLVYHHSVAEGPSTYQANTTTAYDLLRAGKLVHLARTELGQVAAVAISEACVLGFTTIGELETRTLDSLRVEQARATNGSHNVSEDDSDALREIQHAIDMLLQRGHIQRLRSAHLQTHLDTERNAEVYLRSQGLLAAVKGKKGQVELEEQIEAEFRRRVKTDASEYGNVSGPSTGEKRPQEEIEDPRSSKRQRVNGAGMARTNGVSSSETQRARLLIYVNFQNLVSQTRNAFVANKAKRCLGVTNSRVLEAALSHVPNSEPWTGAATDYWLDTESLREHLNRPASRRMVNGTTRNGTDTNGVHEYEEDDADEERMSYNELDRSLALLASSEFKFLQGDIGKDQWRINKKDLDLYVRGCEGFRMMSDRLGPPALRIVRMLMAKGKLDEKTLQEIGLLGAKDLRQTLAHLKEMGYVDLQEVPREAQRQPNRTIFLWFHDPDRARKVLLESLYKAMSRLMQRLKFEKARMTSTLEKAERSDVQGHEQERMSEAEWRILKRWQRKEEWLLGEVARLDESVMLLRDL